MLRALGARVLDASGADVPLGGARAGIDRVGLRPSRAARRGRARPDRCDQPAARPPRRGRGVRAAEGRDARGRGRARQPPSRHLAALLPDVDPLTPGAGAAGGTGFGLLAWGATLEPGSVAVAELIGLPAAAVAASVVITGEGSFDGQSAAGKVPAHVAEAAGPTPGRAGRGAHHAGCRHLGLRRVALPHRPRRLAGCRDEGPRDLALRGRPPLRPRPRLIRTRRIRATASRVRTRLRRRPSSASVHVAAHSIARSSPVSPAAPAPARATITGPRPGLS